MIDGLFHAGVWIWEHLLELLWRSDHDGKSLEKQPPTTRAWWARSWPFLLATIVVILCLAIILRLGGMEL